jgi:hypothetical protein
MEPPNPQLVMDRLRVLRRTFAVLAAATIVILACEPTFTASTVTAPAVGTTVFAGIVWQSDPSHAINVVFVPGTGYGDQSVIANRQVFLNDVGTVIGQDFYQNNAIVSNIAKFNFYFMLPAVNGTVGAGTGVCPAVTWPDLTDAAFADSIIMLHTNNLRDCDGGRTGTAYVGRRVVAVHEFSHAVWSIPDEYCCDGGYWGKAPIMYSSQVACTGDATNAGWRNCLQVPDSNCPPMADPSPPGWWRSEGNNDNIMVQFCGTYVQYGPSNWVVIKQRLQALAGAGTIKDPSVFAPTTWNWP